MATSIIPKPGKPKSVGQFAIAYIDFLGTKDKINKDTESQYLNRLYGMYETASNLCENIPFVKADIKVKVFSDNVILAVPVTKAHPEDDIISLIQFAALFQSIAVVSHNWLVRGGITVGELFLDKLMVWGKGLIRAYDLESRLAVFPRIIADPIVFQEESQGFSLFSSYFRIDEDGLYYVDFLNSTTYIKTDGTKDPLQEGVLKALAEIKKTDGTYDEKAYQKLQWYKNYIKQWYSEHYHKESGQTADLLEDIVK